GFTPPRRPRRRRARGIWRLVLSVSGGSALARRVHRRRRRGVDELECMGGCALVRHGCFDLDAAGLAGHLPCDGRKPWFWPESRRYSRYLAWGWAGASVLRRRGFALHAIARKLDSGASLNLLELVNAIRFGAAAATTFTLGLVLLGVGGVLLAVAIWRASILPRWSGVPLAIALLLLIPQFYLPAWARIAHGILVALALLWLAASLWTTASQKESRPDRSPTINSVTAAM
ncbi:MAG TPA: hypothetical protein VNC13_09445, partial [Propionibacteriaceae bacterium]|nr:hypothetical protein [Propionibacteriaceae bacterium]